MKNKLNVCFDMWGTNVPLPNCMGNHRKFHESNAESSVFFSDFCDPLLKNLKIIATSDLTNIDNDSLKIGYLVEPFSSMDRILIENKFTKYISESTVDYINNKNMYLVINFSHEGCVPIRSFKQFHKLLDFRKISPKKVIFIYNDSNNIITYKKWCDSNGIVDRINILNYQYSLFNKAEELYKLIIYKKTVLQPDISYKSSAVSDDYFKKTKDNIRGHHFLSYNRMIRDHRFLFLIGLESLGLIEKNLVSFNFDFNLQGKTDKDHKGGLYSLLDKNNVTEEKFNEILLKLSKQNDKKTLNSYGTKLFEYGMKVVDYKNLENIVGYGFENSEPYLNSYFSVITESLFFENNLYLSEKSWKGFMHFHPFILFGRPGSLKEMKKYGFKTFEPFIDESYDEEINDIERFFKVMREINRLCKMNLNETHDWYWEMEDILIYNRNLMLEYGRDKVNYKSKYLIENILRSMK